MRCKTLLAVVVATGLAASACGIGVASDDATAVGQATATVSNSETGALLGTTPAGSAIVGADGRSLYGFTNDIDALSTCYSTCADAWPPVIVSPDWIVGEDLDAGIFATTVRDDGQLQLVAGKWPLYFYDGDDQPGDINGQGSGDVWFLVDPAGTLITDTPGPPPLQLELDQNPDGEGVIVEGY